MTHENAQKGLHQLYIGQLLVIIATVLACTVILALFGGIAGIAAVVLEILGLLAASKDDEGYKMALYITLGQFVLSLLANINGFIGRFFSLTNTVAAAAVVWFVITTTVRLLDEAGHSDLAEMGRGCWKTYLTTYAIKVAAALLALIFTKGFFGVLISIVGGVFAIIATFKYVIFLKAAENKV